MLMILVILSLVHAQANINANCYCFCCPSAQNPYGAQKNCDLKNPPLTGSFAIGSPISCTLIGCYSSFSVYCPSTLGFQTNNQSGGAVKWGCDSGCPFDPQGNPINSSSSGTYIDDPTRTSGSVKLLPSAIVLLMIFLF